MLHKYYSSHTTFGRHLCSKPVYLKDHIFWAAVIFSENQAPATWSHTPFTLPAVQRQPADATAVSTWTAWRNDPLGSVRLCKASLWVASVALSSFSQSVSSFYWVLVLRAVGSAGNGCLDARLFPGRNEMLSPLQECGWANPSQT